MERQEGYVNTFLAAKKIVNKQIWAHDEVVLGEGDGVLLRVDSDKNQNTRAGFSMILYLMKYGQL